MRYFAKEQVMRRRNYRRRLGDSDILTAGQFERGSQELNLPDPTGMQSLLFFGGFTAVIVGFALFMRRATEKTSAPVVATNP